MLNNRYCDLVKVKVGKERLKEKISSLKISPEKFLENGFVGKKFCVVFKCPPGNPDKHFGKTTEEIVVNFEVKSALNNSLKVIIIETALDDSTFRIKGGNEIIDVLRYPPFERVKYWTTVDGDLTLEELFFGLTNFRSDLLTISEREKNGGKTREELEREKKQNFRKEMEKVFYKRS